jgi:hypothetical protein
LARLFGLFSRCPARGIPAAFPLPHEKDQTSQTGSGQSE